MNELRSDGSLTILGDRRGNQTAVVPDALDFLAVILGGNNPYSWAALISGPNGVFYVRNQTQGAVYGSSPSAPVCTILDAVWAGGSATFTTDGGTTVSTSDIVRVLGVNPSGYDGLFTVTGVGTDEFTVVMVDNPGTYVASGAVADFSTGSLVTAEITAGSWSSGSGGQATFTTSTALGLVGGDFVTISAVNPAEYNGTWEVVSNTTTTLVVTLPNTVGAWIVGGYATEALGVPFRPAYSSVNDPNVPAGTVVRMRQRYLNTPGTGSADTEYEFNCPDLTVPIRFKNPGVLNAFGTYDAYIEVWSDALGEFTDGEFIEVAPN